ncbi:MAG: hypothetical protein KatS3mg105_1558 [Gemmatales bacterium]|nr:MAG: hypothetical protein KatS3mg105_1558 [Gemmatales bacterium]
MTYDGIQPRDQHNEALVQNVRPPDWQNPKPLSRYHLVVIGGGTAGLVSAAAAAMLGGKVALIERHLLGGDCLNVGCVPSKALIRAARVAAQVRSADKFGVEIAGNVHVNFPAVMERMRRLRARISPHDSARRLADLGVHVFFGTGRFTGPNSIEVGSETLRFRKAVIATGARPVAPPIPGLADVDFFTNETIFSLTQLPERLAIIGAGPIGCELAQSFARFGSRVTLLEVLPHILPAEDRDAADIVAEALRRDGIDIVLDCKIAEVKKENGRPVLVVERSGQTERIVVDAVLVGAGRAPNVDELNLDAAGVAYDKKNRCQG